MVVLGAGYHPSGGFRKSAEPSGLAYERVFGGVKAFKNSRARALAFCEGWRDDARESGTEVMKAFAIDLGVQEDKIITEDKSQNTMENTTELKRLLAPKEQRNIGLVTSAWHMPRSERVFRQVFTMDTIVPIPVGYRYTPSKRCMENMIPSSGVLQTSTEVIHEWVGILWYMIRYSRWQFSSNN
ncbi:YdcF family protein [Planctomycetota bacterium]